jgi:drug/metabolite transporter (DMT)-like permease
MDLALLFGLASAVAYGAGDYLWQHAGRAVGLWRSSFYGALVGFAVLSLWLLMEPAHIRQALAAPAPAWIGCIASAMALAAASILLTQALIRGTLAVVAPVTASYGAVTAVLAALGGERFSGMATLGLVLVIAGACTVAIRPHRKSAAAAGTQSGTSQTGLGWAVAAAIAFGGGFWLQGRWAVPALGAVVPVWALYVVESMLVAGFAFSLRASLGLPEGASIGTVLAAAGLGVAGFVALTLGLATGRLGVVVALSSVTSAITVLLGRMLDGARLAAHQWLAVAAVVAGLMLLRR